MVKLISALAAITLLAPGCGDPCEDLQKKVCDDPAYVKQNKRHCELLQEPARREALPPEFCDSILESLKQR